MFLHQGSYEIPGGRPPLVSDEFPKSEGLKISYSLKSYCDGGRGGGGGGHSNSTFYSVKLCVMINFSLHHNVLCLSFVVVLYSMYSFICSY